MRASGCASCCPRTSPWKACSPTSSTLTGRRPGEPDGRAQGPLTPGEPGESRHIMFGVQGRVITSITLRAAMGRKRALLFAIPPLILLLVHLLTKPVPRSVVIWSKYAVAVVLTAAFVAVPELLAGLIATGGPTKLAVGLFIGALAGSVMYNAIFVMVSVVTTRAIAYGLAYVLIWESLLANLVSGARLLSVGQYSLGVANGIAHNATLNAGLTLGTSAVMGVIVTAAALVVAIRALSSFSLKGDAI